MENFPIKKKATFFSIRMLLFIIERSLVWVIWYMRRVFV